MNIKAPSKAVEQTTIAPISGPTTKAKVAASIPITAANMLMSAEKNIIGASNMKAIIRYHTSQSTELTSSCPFRRVSYRLRGYPRSILPSPPTWQSSPLPTSPQNYEDFCGLSLFCHPESCFPVGHDQENDQHYQPYYYPYPDRDRGYPELNRLRPGAFVAIVIYYLDPPVVGAFG